MPKKAKIFKEEKTKYIPEVAQRISPEGDCAPEHRAIHVENWINQHDGRIVDDIIKSINSMPASHRTAGQMKSEIASMVREEYLEEN